MSKPTVCILYGACEGQRIARRFIVALEASGFVLTHDPLTADIIFAHSGGCYVVPVRHRAQLILLVGLSGTPGIANLRKAWLDFRTQHRAGTLKQFATKTFWNALYFWNMPQNWRMWRGWRRGAQRALTHVVAIRNRDDRTAPAELAHFHFDHPPALISFPGQHDDCWEHPEPYIHIIQKYLPRP
jgi:hypothetical protein